jgi:hypothetical protein
LEAAQQVGSAQQLGSQQLDLQHEPPTMRFSSVAAFSSPTATVTTTIADRIKRDFTERSPRIE